MLANTYTDILFVILKIDIIIFTYAIVAFRIYLFHIHRRMPP